MTICFLLQQRLQIVHMVCLFPNSTFCLLRSVKYVFNPVKIFFCVLLPFHFTHALQ